MGKGSSAWTPLHGLGFRVSENYWNQIGRPPNKDSSILGSI